MNLATPLATIRDALANNAAIKVWTQATYTKDHKVYVGIDPRNPPPDTAYPLIALSPADGSEGWSEDVSLYTIGIGCGIIQEAQTTGLAANIVQYAGVMEIEAFRKKVEDAITGIVESTLGGRVDSLKVEYETIEFFPSFLCHMIFTIVKEQSQGDDPYQ